MSLTSYRAAPPRAEGREVVGGEGFVKEGSLMLFAGLATTYSPRS